MDRFGYGVFGVRRFSGRFDWQQCKRKPECQPERISIGKPVEFAERIGKRQLVTLQFSIGQPERFAFQQSERIPITQPEHKPKRISQCIDQREFIAEQFTVFQSIGKRIPIGQSKQFAECKPVGFGECQLVALQFPLGQPERFAISESIGFTERIGERQLVPFEFTQHEPKQFSIEQSKRR